MRGSVRVCARVEIVCVRFVKANWRTIIWFLVLTVAVLIIIHVFVLCRSRHGYLLQLKVLEAICQRIHKPDLCVQKDSIITLELFK